ncbi:hypothetical protein ACNRDB_03495 [Ralstonia pseudosolanacearum]|uniref:hypothetical protein n=1 Tax=Ralstonia pseudosolanacearum TaxID=1310165 RepID=UPI0018D0A5BA|nr:hypothetical protein [Ralstonia pseudosolanacearum]
MREGEFIDNAEIVYRRVPNDPMFFSVVGGKLRVHSVAFNDKTQKPSVERSSLLDNEPQRAKTVGTQGVVGLVTGSVRGIDTVTQTDTDGNVIKTHQIDVVPDKLPDNPAHALITHAPEFQSKRPFERLKERLARLAEKEGWLVEPS